MSEQEKPKSSFMQELAEWARAEVIDPLLYAGARSVESADTDWEEEAESAVQAIKNKVLESYRNGLAAARREGVGQDRPQFPRRAYPPKAEVKTSRVPVRG